MIIRKAREDDLKIIDQIYLDGSIIEGKLQFPKTSINKIKRDLNKYQSSRRKGFLKEMKLKNNYWIVAEQEGKIVGFGQAWIKTKEIGIIEKVYTDKIFARQGIGLKLLKELEKWLISKKVKLIQAGIYYNNKPSIELNKKAGYEPISLKVQKKVNKS